MNKIIRLGILVMIIFVASVAKAYDHPSNCTVKIAEGSEDCGVVAIKHSKYTNGYQIFGAWLGGDGDAGKDTDPKYPDDYGSSGYDEYTFTGGQTRTVAYYIYARPADGYEFSHWSTKEGNTYVQITTGIDKINNPEDCWKYSWSHSAGLHSKTIYAHFNRKERLVKTETNNKGGKIELSNDDPLEGEEVTAKIVLNKLDKNVNMMSYFSHWENEDGEWLSDEMEYTFAAKPILLRAIFKSKGAVNGEVNQKLEAGKYYRVRNAYNRVLSIEGKFDAKLSINSLDVPTSLLRWALPLDYDDSQFNVGSGWNLSDAYMPIWPEATPSTVFYIEKGTQDGDNLTNVRITGQGVNTYDVTGYELYTENSKDYFGYFTLNATVLGNHVIFKAFDRSGYGIVNVSSPSDLPMVAMAIQPIDEAHVNDFWFGAYAEEKVKHEEGYWTSMYTAFPYKLYDSGIKAYYLKKQQPQTINGEAYLMLEEIEDGIVPAYTAVLLKCDEPENTKANRMLPLDPTTVNKTIDDNLLEGVFQLYERDPKPQDRDDEYVETRMKNADNIRVLGVTSAGKVGFYKLAGDDTLLAANKAYLDVNKLGEDIKTMSIKFGTLDGATTGVESVVVNDNDENAGEEVIYDLYGRRIANPAAGNIYIVNGKKVLWK